MAQDAAPPAFEVATVKPALPNQPGMGNRTTPASLILSNNDLRHAILYAYKLQEYQLSGGAKWVSSETFDITGKADASTTTLSPEARQDRMRAMLRSLLAERFQLVLQREVKPVPAFALTVAKGGFKLKKLAPDVPSRGISTGGAMLKAQGATVAKLADLLAAKLSRPVVDQTNIKGRYDFDLQFAPDNAPPHNPAPSIFTALEEQCGLKLKQTTVPAETFTIERAERPSAN
jgi:uncharacterized protein (TIGR03435 family)